MSSNSNSSLTFKETIVHSDISEYYNMHHKHRGIALILNHYEFKGQPKREGTEVDCKSIAKQLENLAFHVVLKHDLTLKELKANLQKIAEMDHTENDCLVVVVMTHGKAEDELFARDKAYPVHTLWDPFVGENCKTLIGKPKLFFVQACRGYKYDDGVALRNPRSIVQTDSNGSNVTDQMLIIPTMADFLVMYSTYEDHYAWRNRGTGSWFIQSLCNEFELNGKIRDLLSILTGVIRRVAYLFESDCPEADKKKQCPMLVSMLTKTLYFTPKIENAIN